MIVKDQKKMKFVFAWLGKLFALGLIGLVGIFILVLGRWLLDADNDAILLFMTPTLAFIGVIYSTYVNKSRDIAEQHKLKKAETYQALFDYLDYLNENVDKVADPDFVLPDEIKRIVRKLSEGMLIWCSPQVVKSWLKYRQVHLTNDNGLDVMDDLIRAIRVDLNNDNNNLGKGDLIKVYLKNPQEYEEIAKFHASKSGLLKSSS